jgi:hypothetical protein
MKIIRILLYAMSFLLTQNCYAGILYPTAKITVRAIDTKGNVIPDAEVRVTFYVDKGAGMGWGLSSKFIQGRSDKMGLYAAESDSIDRCSFSVKKEGFYNSYDEVYFQKVSLLRRWEPWNPIVDIVLKVKRDPVAMYAKRTDSLKVPILDTPIGYDFEKSDWVAPYGKGVLSDFVFTCKIRFASRDDKSTAYKLTFSNPMDGIQEYIPDKNDRSEFRWPYDAPETGYKPELSLFDSYKGTEKYTPGYDDKKRYVFRIRTQVDEKGNIISAKYGKIKGDIELLMHGMLRFEYYFNPSGSRSLEFGSSLTEWTSKREREKQEVKGP